MAISVRQHLRRALQRFAPMAHAAATRRDRNVDGGAEGALLDRPDLLIRDLRDDPRLRRAMGLDDAEPASPRTEPRFDRRHLLDRAAA